MDEDDDTFTFAELRIALTAFAMWLRSTDLVIEENFESGLVDRFLEETT